MAGSVGACAVVALVGCGGSTRSTGTSAASPSGAAAYVGQATNAEVFIQWTRAGNGLSGSLQEAVRAEGGGSGVESSSRAFTGTIDGDGLTLTLNEGLGSTKALVGKMTANGFTMTFPSVGHRLVTITFVPGQVSDYNHAVSELEGSAEQEPSSTGPEESSTPTSTSGGFPVYVEKCGTLEGPSGAQLTVTTEDHVGCPEALGVFRDLFAGKGDRHQGTDEADSYTTVDGWSCGSGAGGFGCRRLGVDISAEAG
jgi:hypothetical protein